MLTQEQSATFEKLKQEIIDFDNLVRGDREYDEELQNQLIEAEYSEMEQEEFGSFNYYKEVCDNIVTNIVYIDHKGKAYEKLEESTYLLYLLLVQTRMEWMLPLVIKSNKSKLVYFSLSGDRDFKWIHLDWHSDKLTGNGRYKDVKWEVRVLKEEGWECAVVWRDSTGKYLKGPRYKTTKQLLEEKLNG